MSFLTPAPDRQLILCKRGHNVRKVGLYIRLATQVLQCRACQKEDRRNYSRHWQYNKYRKGKVA